MQTKETTVTLNINFIDRLINVIFGVVEYSGPKNLSVNWSKASVFSERELTFTFAI